MSTQLPLPFVRQEIAKRGICVDSFEDKDAFMSAATTMVKVMKRFRGKRLVYTIVPIGTRKMWQIFLVNKT